MWIVGSFQNNDLEFRAIPLLVDRVKGPTVSAFTGHLVCGSRAQGRHAAECPGTEVLSMVTLVGVQERVDSWQRGSAAPAVEALSDQWITFTCLDVVSHFVSVRATGSTIW